MAATVETQSAGHAHQARVRPLREGRQGVRPSLLIVSIPRRISKWVCVFHGSKAKPSSSADLVVIRVTAIRPGVVKLFIEAPANISILRGELLDRVAAGLALPPLRPALKVFEVALPGLPELPLVEGPDGHFKSTVCTLNLPDSPHGGRHA